MSCLRSLVWILFFTIGILYQCFMRCMLFFCITLSWSWCCPLMFYILYFIFYFNNFLMWLKMIYVLWSAILIEISMYKWYLTWAYFEKDDHYMKLYNYSLIFSEGNKYFGKPKVTDGCYHEFHNLNYRWIFLSIMNSLEKLVGKIYQ